MHTLQHAEDLFFYFSGWLEHAASTECLIFLPVEANMQGHEDGKPVHIWWLAKVWSRNAASVFSWVWKLESSLTVHTGLQKLHLRVLLAATSVAQAPEVCRGKFWVTSLLCLRVSAMYCDGIEESNSKMAHFFYKRLHSELKPAYRPFCICKFLFSIHTCLQYSQEGRAAYSNINGDAYFIKCWNALWYFWKGW